METVGAMCEGDQWGSFYGVYSEEADFMEQLLGNCSNQKDLTNFTIPSNVYSSDESANASINLSPSTNLASYYYPGNTNNEVFGGDNSWMSFGYTAIEDKDNNDVTEGDEFVNNDGSESNKKLQLGREVAMPMPPPCQEDKVNSLEMSKKRPRIPRETQKNKRSTKQKKVLNHDNNDDNKDYNNDMLHVQTSSDCCSEDESNASHKHNGGATSSSSSKASGKTRASRGSATDPQSLYARKRRERINERLRILQNLVPNGTKVDISTMLEEAVQYVKFLQLQIKLLSSDDLWMYAPLAYNGMDIGLDLKISNS